MPLTPNPLLQVEQLETGDKFAQAKSLTNTNVAPINEPYRTGAILSAETDIWLDTVFGFPAQLGPFPPGSSEPLPAPYTTAQTFSGPLYVGTKIPTSVPAGFVWAAATIQDLTYQAVTTGIGGNQINIVYTSAVQPTATVAVSGSVITVTLSSTVLPQNIATLIAALINTTSASASLVRVAVTGVGGTQQTSPVNVLLAGAVSHTYLRFGGLTVAGGADAPTSGIAAFQLYTIPNSGVYPGPAPVAGTPITTPGQEQSFVVVSQPPISDAFQDIQAVHLTNLIPPSFNDPTLGPLADASVSSKAPFGVPNGYRMVLVPALTGGAAPTPDLLQVITDAIPLINALYDPQKTGSRLTIDYKGGIVRLSLPPPPLGSATAATTEINPNNVFDANGRVILFAVFYQYVGHFGAGIYQNLGSGQFAELSYGTLATTPFAAGSPNGWIMTFGGSGAEVYFDNTTSLLGQGFEIGAQSVGGTNYGYLRYASAAGPTDTFTLQPSVGTNLLTLQFNGTTVDIEPVTSGTMTIMGSKGSTLNIASHNLVNTNIGNISGNATILGSTINISANSAAETINLGNTGTTINVGGWLPFGTSANLTSLTANSPTFSDTYYSGATGNFTNFVTSLPAGGIASGFAGGRFLFETTGGHWHTHNANPTNFTVVSSEGHGTTVGGTTTYTFSLSHTPVAPRSIKIIIGVLSVLPFEIGNGILLGVGVAAGSYVNYTTGLITLNLVSDPGTGSAISVSYNYGYTWSADDFNHSAMAFVIDSEGGFADPFVGTYSYFLSEAGSAWPQFSQFSPLFLISSTTTSLTVLPSTTITVANAVEFPAGGGVVSFYSSTGLQSFTYTSRTGTIFTGASQGTGTLEAGAVVTWNRNAITPSTITLPATTITVDSTATFPPSGAISFYTSDNVIHNFTYTSTTATTFVGPSSGAGTLLAGTPVTYSTGGWQYRNTIQDSNGNMVAAGSITAGVNLNNTSTQANSARFVGNYYSELSQDFTHLLTSAPSGGIQPGISTHRQQIGSDGAWWSTHNAKTTNPTVVVNESLGNTSSGTFTYTGSLLHSPVNPFSLSIQFGVGSTVARDTEGNGNLLGTGITSGSINYNTGAYTVTLISNPGVEAIVADYTYGYQWSADDSGNAAFAFVIEAESGNLTQPVGAYLYTQSGVNNTNSSTWPQNSNQSFHTTGTIGTWTGNIVFNGTLFAPVVPGSVQAFDGLTHIVTDNNNPPIGSFSASYNSATVSGTINYASGSYSLSFSGGSPTGGNISIKYFQVTGWSQRTTLMDANGDMVISGNLLTIGGNPTSVGPGYPQTSINFQTYGTTYGPQQGTILFDQNNSLTIKTKTAAGPAWQFNATNGVLYLAGDIDTITPGNNINVGAVAASIINIGSTSSSNLFSLQIVTPSIGVININSGTIDIEGDSSTNINTANTTGPVIIGYPTNGFSSGHVTNLQSTYVYFGNNNNGGTDSYIDTGSGNTIFHICDNTSSDAHQINIGKVSTTSNVSTVNIDSSSSVNIATANATNFTIGGNNITGSGVIDGSTLNINAVIGNTFVGNSAGGYSINFAGSNTVMNSGGDFTKVGGQTAFGYGVPVLASEGAPSGSTPEGFAGLITVSGSGTTIGLTQVFVPFGMGRISVYALAVTSGKTTNPTLQVQSGSGANTLLIPMVDIGSANAGANTVFTYTGLFFREANNSIVVTGFAANTTTQMICSVELLV